MKTLTAFLLAVLFCGSLFADSLPMNMAEATTTTSGTAWATAASVTLDVRSGAGDRNLFDEERDNGYYPLCLLYFMEWYYHLE